MSELQKKFKVACVGTGYFSRFHYQAWARIKNVELVASVNRNIEGAKATGLPAFDDLVSMLEAAKPDVLDIITPPQTHLGYIQKAVGSDIKAIICQKPFCQNIDEARQAVAICAKAQIPLIVHENFRFQPWYRTMKRAIDSGTIGDIHQLTFRLRTGDGQGPNAYLDRQPYFQKMSKFLIHETGVHWIDTFCYLLGRPLSVYADLRKMNPAIAGEDAGYFIMEFDGGKRALFDANRHLDHCSENHRLTLGESLLEGTRGTITLTGDGVVSSRKFGSTEHDVLLAGRNWPGFAGDCVHALQSHVISGLLGDMVFENSAADYLLVLELEAAIYASSENGRKMEF
jgi:predicted dehydrogenase